MYGEIFCEVNNFWCVVVTTKVQQKKWHLTNWKHNLQKLIEKEGEIIKIQREREIDGQTDRQTDRKKQQEPSEFYKTK